MNDFAELLSRSPRRASAVRDGDYYELRGGLNLVDTPLRRRPGDIIGAINYEVQTRGGYTRFHGMERFDGRTKPSEALYYLLPFDGGTPGNYPAAGDTINGQTSGATGVVLLAPVESATGVGYLVLGRVTGTFQNNENLREVTTVFALADGTAAASSASTDDLDTAYKALATEDQRALITVVPGSGPVRGVATYNGAIYAWRNNAGGTACVMHKATAAGWTAVPDFPLLRFNTGSPVRIVAGNTIVGASSAASAVVRRVVVTSGSWESTTAAGYVILAAGTYGFTMGEQLNVGGNAAATSASTAAATAIAPGGRFEFREHNFYGSTATKRLYGVDGVNKGFEYQDSPEFYCPVETGMSADTPTHLAATKARLWYSFAGGSLQNSGVNDPVVFDVVTGASEMAAGDEITGMLEEIGDALFVFCRNRTKVVLGSGPQFDFKDHSIDTGAYERSMQRIGNGVFLDDRGFTSLAAVQDYGNFKAASLSDRIDPIVDEIRQTAACSLVSRGLNLYRLFLTDGRFVSISIVGGKSGGIMLCDIGKVAYCAVSGEISNGNDVSLIGATDGFVYQLDAGTSLDGEALEFFLKPAFHFSRTPSRVKRYRRVQFDLSNEGRCTLNISPEYSYGAPDVSADPLKTITLYGGGGTWDVSQWEHFRWDAPNTAECSMKLEGSGTNISFIIAGSQTVEPPHTIQGVMLHESLRRINRGVTQ
jgi:hypothetical protein